MSDSLAAVIFGATGAVGSEVLKELTKSPKFSKVILIVRKEIENIKESKIVQRVVDFDHLSDHKDTLEGINVAYCCLGTTRNKSGADGLVKVDRDYVYEAAKICKASNCSHFHLVTSSNANSQSSLLYMKTKGEAENLVSGLGFQRLSIYRPALLLCDRQESRPLEKFGQILAKGFDWRSKFSISVDVVAHAMVVNTLLNSTNPVEYFENSDINKLGID